MVKPMLNKIVTDNTRLLLCAVADALDSGASPRTLALYSKAAAALADGDLKRYVALFALGENYASF